MATEEEESWLASLMAALGRKDEGGTKKEREMVRSPAPEPPTFVQREDEQDMDFRLRKKRELRAYDKLLRDMEASPENYMVPAAAAEAEATQEISRYERRKQLDMAEQELGTQ